MSQVPYSREMGGYGVTFVNEHPLPVSVKTSSPHAQVGSTRLTELAITPPPPPLGSGMV